MGNGLNGIKLILFPDVTPNPDFVTKFDPHLGFSAPRKKKEMPMTDVEMDSCGLYPFQRHFCSNYLAELMACHRRNWPYRKKYCWPEEKAWEKCELREEHDRFRDYERERRLMVRAKRIQQKKQAILDRRAKETQGDVSG